MALMNLLATFAIALVIPSSHCQIWAKIPELPDKAIQVEASDDGLFDLFAVSNKNQLFGFKTTNQAWLFLRDGVKNVGAGYDNSSWIVLMDDSILRALFSGFGTPLFASPPVNKKLFQISPMNFEKATGVDIANDIYTLDTAIPKPEWKKLDGAASWVSTDKIGGIWTVNRNLTLNDSCCNIFHRVNDKWVSKPGGAVTINAQSSSEQEPLVVITSPIKEIFIFSGSIYKPDTEGRPWTKLAGLLADQCSISDKNMYCVATNGTIFKTPVSGFESLPKQVTTPLF